ncbi:MAG: DUF5683 domain-containing protein [Bacteroidota bacterium]
MLKQLLILSAFLVIGTTLFAQAPIYESSDSLREETTSVQADTLPPKKFFKSFFQDDYPSPKKAALIAIIPGMGQIYNKKYWKLPIVYGALGGVIYSIRNNTNNYNNTVKSLAVKEEISMLMAMGEEISEELANSDPLPDTPANAVTAQRNSFDKNRQLSWIGVVAFYLMSAGDALVDAHLKDFNVDDDISFRPTFETNYLHQPTVGLSIRIPLSK